MKEKIENIIKKVLPNFYYEVSEKNQPLSDGTYLKIVIAADSSNKAQMVSFSLSDKLFLEPQGYGGYGGRCIYREPNKEVAEEKYLAMKSVKVPFKTPQRSEASVVKAFEKFCEEYRLLLIENINALCYRGLVDYAKLLNL